MVVGEKLGVVLCGEVFVIVEVGEIGFKETLLKFCLYAGGDEAVDEVEDCADYKE